MKNICCLGIGLTLFCLGGCGQHNTSSAPLTAKAPVVMSEEKTADIAPQENMGLSKDSLAKDPLDPLKNGKNVPLLIIVTSDPGNSDIDVMEEKLHEIDIKASLDQAVGRERTFDDFPYTVGSYLITINSMDGYQRVLDCTYRFPKLKMLIIPFTKVKLISYLKLTYSQPLLGEKEPKVMWIGNSKASPIPHDFSDLNLEDPAVIADVMANCRDFDAVCFGALLKQGYFSNETLIGEKLTRPLEDLSAEIHASATLIASHKISGDAQFPRSLLNNTYADSVIKDMTLIHELWVSGEPRPQEPEPLLLKVAGADGHPIVSKNLADGGYLFRLPIQIPSSNIPIRVRGQIPSMSLLLSQMEREIETNAGVAGL